MYALQLNAKYLKDVNIFTTVIFRWSDWEEIFIPPLLMFLFLIMCDHFSLKLLLSCNTYRKCSDHKQKTQWILIILMHLSFQDQNIQKLSFANLVLKFMTEKKVNHFYSVGFLLSIWWFQDPSMWLHLALIDTCNGCLLLHLMMITLFW